MAKRRDANGNGSREWVHLTPKDIVDFRQEHDLSKNRVAKHLGVSLPSLNKYMSGDGIPTTKVQQRMRKALERSIDSQASAGGGGRSRGRQPGAWSLVSAEELESFRARTGMSKLALAQQLGVSAGSVNNWLVRGKAPSNVQQEKIRKLIDGGAPAGATPKSAPAKASAQKAASAPAAAPPRPSARAGASGGEAALGAVELVKAYIQAGAKLDADRLPELVRQVKLALE